LVWWVIVLIFGLVGWPLAFSLLRYVPDRGFAFTRSVGLLLTGYILWLGGTFRLLPNSVGGIVVSLGVVLAMGLIWRRRQIRSGDRESMLAWLRREWRYALTVELLFSLTFAAWVIYKAYNPNIETAGGEKWMEIAFINGTLRSDYFPPQDPWLSGFAISYYYFGYVLMAMVTRLTGLLSVIAFNLYVPTLLAMTLTAALGITANIVQLSINNDQLSNERVNPNRSGLRLGGSAIGVGLVGALFVGLIGHLEGLLEVLHKRGLLPAGFWTWLDIRDLKIPPTGLSDSWIPDRFIWWWRGSRVLTDYTLTGKEQEVIDEFPFFSFLLGDVHPHVLALPFVLLVIALALNLLANRSSAAGRRSPANRDNLVDKALQILRDSWLFLLQASGGRPGFVLYAVSLGALSFLNTWDFPIYLSVVGLAFFVWLVQSPPPPAKNKQEENLIPHPSSLIPHPSSPIPHPSSFILPGAVGTALLGVAGVILYLPFYATFQSQARGVLPNLWNPARLPQFFVFFGIFLAATVFLLIVLSRRSPAWRQHLGWSLPLTVLGPVLMMLIALSGVLLSPSGREYVQGVLNNPETQQLLGDTTIGALVQESLWRRLLNPWTFLLLGGLLGWAVALFVGRLAGWQVGRLEDWRRGGEEEATMPVVMVANVEETPLETFGGRQSPVGGLLVPEQFVLILILVGLGLPLAVEFVYLRDNFGIRMNTIFKFYFQAWVLLALASAFAVYYVSRHLRGITALAWQAGMVLLVGAGLIYPVLAIADKTNYFKNEPTLNGIEWIAQTRPGDYAAIEWLGQYAADDAVILEAPGAHYAAYQYTSRVSALTGLPTLLGWGGHQSQWRGNYDEPARREPDIDTLFNTSDLRQAQELLDKYHITYVYVGPLERERYSPQGLNKFTKLMAVVFQQGDVTIYQRK
ncbi:MAG: DUF2298 domain-containing protein, partial [Chloroflexota bacterium]